MSLSRIVELRSVTEAHMGGGKKVLTFYGIETETPSKQEFVVDAQTAERFEKNIGHQFYLSVSHKSG